MSERQEAYPERPPAQPAAADWRGPAFWMVCGALLMALAGGAVMLAQRVAAERDWASLALPAAAPVAAQPAAGAAPQAGAGPAAAASPGPRQDAAPPAPGPAAKAKGRSGRQSVARQARLGKESRAMRERYAAVFKRCPRPGEAGAVACRRHICNGAAGKGPACRLYGGKGR